MDKVERYMELYLILKEKCDTLNDEEYGKYFDSVEDMLCDMDDLWYKLTDEEVEIVRSKIKELK